MKSDFEKTESLRNRALRPVRPRMSFPWVDARPEPVPEVRHSLVINGRTFHLFWGDIHGHCNLSADSWYHGPDRYYEYGRNTARLDFCALTDHDAPLSLARYPDRWNQAVAATNRANQPGRFVTLPAFEWTSGTPSGSMIPRMLRRGRWDYLKDPTHFGHRNVYFPGQVPDHVFSHDDPRYDTPEKLWKAMAPYDAISIPHHPLGGPVCPLKWDHFNPACEPVAEIYSTHGNSEHEGCRHQIYNPYLNGRHSVQAPLEDGVQFGFIASSDTHMGLAGNHTIPDFNISFSQWYFRGETRPPGPGVAAVYARDLTREGIFEALRARRCYAVTGARMILDVRAAGRFMGQTLAAPAMAPVPVCIRARAHRPIVRIDIVKNGRCAATFQPDSTEITLDHMDMARERARDWLYVRVLQNDAHMAWSSPVWIERE